MSRPWAEEWRPATVAECVLPAKVMKEFTGFLERGTLPVNLLLHGDSGIGKTTVAKALCSELDLSVLTINASEMRMADFRDVVTSFVTTKTIDDKGSDPNRIKVVLLDEADHINSAIQPALRNFMEEFSRTTRFILTCNYPEKIIKPLRSRCVQIGFLPENAKDKQEMYITMAQRIWRRTKEAAGLALSKEDRMKAMACLVELISKTRGDFRAVIQAVQLYVETNGTIDEGILATSNVQIEALLKAVKSGNWQATRDFCTEHRNNADNVFSALFEEGVNYIDKSSLTDFIIIVGEHAYRHAFFTDPSINLASMAMSLSRSVKWK